VGSIPTRPTSPGKAADATVRSDHASLVRWSARVDAEHAVDRADTGYGAVDDERTGE
jgi:hypothetical protein